MKIKNKIIAVKTPVSENNIDFLCKHLYDRGFTDLIKENLLPWYNRGIPKFLIFDSRGEYGNVRIVGEYNKRVEVDNDTFLFLSENPIKYPIIDINNNFREKILNLSIGDFFIIKWTTNEHGLLKNHNRLARVLKRTKDKYEIYDDVLFGRITSLDDLVYKNNTIYYPTMW